MNVNEWNLIDLLINIMSSVLAVEYIHHGFEKKYAGAKRFLLFLCGTVIYFLTVSFLLQENRFEGITGLAYGVILLIYGVLALDGRFSEKAMISMLWVLITLMGTYITYGLSGFVTGRSLDTLFTQRGYERLYISLIAALIKFLMGRVVLRVKKKRVGLGQMEDWVMVCALFLVYVIITGMFQLQEEAMSQKTRNQLLLILLSGTCGIILSLGYLHHKLDEKNYKLMEAEILLKMNESKENNLKHIWKKDQEIRKVRHDLKGSMDVLHRLMKTGNIKDALGYMEEIDANIKSYPELPQDTGNEGLNSSLLSASWECQERGIEFCYLICRGLETLDAMDMGILFTNLFSNAIEACDKVSTEKVIYLEIERRNGELYCRLENNIADSVLEKNPTLKTTKKEKHFHGFGMESILNVISKYNGKYRCFEEKEGIFVQEILLKVDL